MAARRPAKKPLRILCLHGMHTNAQVMKDQMRGLYDALGENAEFIYLNGPNEAEGPIDEMLLHIYGKDAKFYDWGQTRKHKREPIISDTSDSNRSQDDEWSSAYGGFEQLRSFFDHHLPRLGPFDAVVGFSQGAVLATIISTWYLAHRNNTRWWKLCVLFSAPRIRDADVRSLFEHPDGSRKLVPFSSIHVYGKKDPMYKECRGMVDMYGDNQMNVKKFVFEHESGHRFPSPKYYTEMYADMARRIQEICREEHVKNAPTEALPAKL